MTTVASAYSPTMDRTDRIRFGAGRGLVVGGTITGSALAMGMVSFKGRGVSIGMPSANKAIAAGVLGLSAFAGIAVSHLIPSRDQDSRHLAGVIASTTVGAAGGAYWGSRVLHVPWGGQIGGAVAGGIIGAAATGVSSFFGLPFAMA